MDAQEVVNSLYACRDKNLAYFQQVYPGIFSAFAEAKFHELSIDVSPEGTNIEVLRNGNAVYGGNMYQRINDEVEEFVSHFSDEFYRDGVSPIFPESIRGMRFAHARLRQMLEAMPLRTNNFKGLKAPEKLPLLIFTGIGTGLHIAKLLAKKAASHVIIFEPFSDDFLISLFFTDWSNTLETAKKNHGTQFTFKLYGLKKYEGSDKEYADYIFTEVWNELPNFFPFFPCHTYLYNHLANEKYGQMNASIQKEIENFKSVWGFYDDEVNQINNTLHNINNGMKILKKQNLMPTKAVMIIGSGPSLENSLKIIKEYRDAIVLVSSGSSLKRILDEGLMPDFHVEQESNYENYEILSSYDHNKLKDIVLLCPTQISPLMSSLFKEVYYFIKFEVTSANLFKRENEKIKATTPSCVNGAAAVMIHMGYETIIFTGTDFGYKDISKHHVSGLFYETDDEQAKKVDKQASGSYLYETRDGIDVYTTRFLNLCKSHLERKVAETKINNEDRHFYNFSDGISIQYVPFIEENEVIDVITSRSKNKPMNIKSYTVHKNRIRKFIDEGHVYLSRVSAELSQLAGNISNDEKSVSKAMYAMNDLIFTQPYKDKNSLASLLRGSIWCYLYTFYINFYAVENQEQRQLVIDAWVGQLQSFLADVPEHYLQLLDKDFDQIDPVVKLTIFDKELSDKAYV